MSNPEEKTVQENGNQESTESTEQQTTVTEEQANETSSYYDSDESLSKKINELTLIAETGDPEAVSSALNELNEIEGNLQKIKDNPQEKPKEKETQPTTEEPTKTEEKTDPTEEAKKFTVHWQGEKIEREDVNNLLGYKTTGDLKAAFIKQELANKAREQDLLNRLNEANEKLSQPKPQQPPPPQPRRTVAPPVQTKPIERPVPPELPVLSTQDPTLYTEEDIAKLQAHQKATGEFNQKMINYVDSVRNQPGRTEPSVRKELDELKKWREEAGSLISAVEKEKQELEQERREIDHWKRFSDFMDKHDSFKTPLPPKQMNEKMQEWMDSVATANGVQPANGQRDDNYMYNRAIIVSKFLANDPQTIQNAQGIKTPEGHEAYFKMLELNNALGKYIDSDVFSKNATLEDAYLRMKADSGEMENDIETMRTQERTKATQEFASGVEELQQHAAGVDPTKSAGGPDMNSLGFSKEDMRWFTSINQQDYAALQTKDPEAFKKWNKMADAINNLARQ